MKTLATALLMTFVSFNLQASPSVKPAEFKFVFNPSKPKESFTIKTKATSQDVAFKLAAKECYQKLTQGRYPGEEHGLDIIDICANPKM